MTFEKVKDLREEARIMEDDLGIPVRWNAGSAKFQKGVQDLVTQNYQDALGELELLIVKQLIELTKLNIGGICTDLFFVHELSALILCLWLVYNQREKINQALKNRLDAIHTSLDKYNKAAKALNRDQLTMAEVMKMTSIADFHLLGETRDDIRNARWTHHDAREATWLYFRVKQAREEVERLNVEMKRQITYMIEEHTLYSQVYAQIRKQNFYLATYLDKERKHRDEIFAHVTNYILKTSCLQGFTGSLGAGKWTGLMTDKQPTWLQKLLGEESGGDEHNDKDGEIDDRTDDDDDNDEYSIAVTVDVIEKLIM
jgi:hypothetical protein